MEDFEDDYENEDYENDEEYLEELHEEEDKRDIRVKRRDSRFNLFFLFVEGRQLLRIVCARFVLHKNYYMIYYVLGLDDLTFDIFSSRTKAQCT